MNLKHPSVEMRGQTEAEFLANAPILDSLKARLDACRSPREWALARAQQALYLVRTYRIDEAKLVPDEIRAQFRGHEEPEVYYWLWLLEAVLDFYQTGATNGMQKIPRAMLMARSLKRSDLEEYLAAWAAHFCFTDGKYDEMVRWLKLSRLHEAALPEAACRASLVAAVAWQTCGEEGTATLWFGRAREIARLLGDRATIMASIANRGAIRLNDLWVNHFFGRQVDSDLASISSEVLGALGYERLTGTDALIPQAHIFRMRLAYLRSDIVAVCQALRQAATSVKLDSYSILRANDIFEVWLRVVKLNDPLHSNTLLDELEDGVHQMDFDDAAVCWRMMSDIARKVEDLERSSIYEAHAVKYINEYDSERGNLRRLLVDMYI